MGIIRAALFFCYGARSGKWVLADITDSTSRNATSAIAHHFSHWAEAPKRSVTSGLLVMEASLLPAALPIAPSVDSNVGKFSVSTSLNSSDLTIWGVNLGSLWRAIMTKIERELEATVTDKPRRLCRLAEWETRIGASRTVAELLIIEAKAAADYWRAFADRGLREAKGGNLPRTWLRFANRQKGAGFLGSKNASHPINAMLNYAYTVEAGRLAKALAARGLALQIGFLHSDKTGRNSLVWDAIEPLRPIIDARVFRYIETREFKRRDFVQTSASTYRLERDIIAELLTKVSLLQAEIDEAADTMLKIIERYAGAEYRLFKADLRRRKRVAKQVAPSN
jgi:CRISPR/Cas system-associated endonuclease Cas1